MKTVKQRIHQGRMNMKYQQIHPDFQLKTKSEKEDKNAVGREINNKAKETRYQRHNFDK